MTNKELDKLKMQLADQIEKETSELKLLKVQSYLLLSILEVVSDIEDKD